MFYSHELLGRKSPLGAVWIAAHGKKLNRHKVMNVNVVQTCDQIINPEVPQALRLQGILIGGIVIVFKRQQSYLLEDCNDILRKVRAVTVDQQAVNTVLEKNKQQARPDAITAPDLDQLFGGHLNLAFMHPFATSLQLDQAPLEDDLFVMPTLPDGAEEGSTHHERPQRNTTAIREPRLDRHIVGLPTGLELQDTMLMDQEETFMMPELGMDMFETGMAAVPEMLNNGPEEKVLPLPEEMMMEPMQATDAEPLHDEHTAAAPAMPFGQDAREGLQVEEVQPAAPPIGSLEAVVQEQAAAEGAAKQARARARGRGRKRPTQFISDDADATQIRGTVFRAWTQNTDELIQERPHKLMRPVLVSQYPGCRPSAVPFGADLLCGPPLSARCDQGGKWSEQLQSLLVSSMTPRTAEGDGQNHVEPPGWQQNEHQEMELQEMEMPGMDMPDEAQRPGATAAAADIDLPEHTANDIFMLEEEVEVERLRGALATPGSMTEQDHAKAVQLGLTPGSSNPLERRGHKKQKRTSSGFRVESDSRPTEHRSSPQSQRRLSDLMVGADVGEMGLGLEGHLEDMIAPELEDLEGMPQQEHALDRRLHGAGGLTQFQLMEDSGPATQTQKAVPDAITKNTLSMIGLLRDKFTDLEGQGGEEPPALSVFQMTASLTRTQAAKLFYQICVTHSNNFIQAAQEVPYGDIIINRGAFL